jgi:putative ABC transport system permease protein
MMPDVPKNNRAMFWRIVRRLLGSNRGRLFVILLALGAGAAVTAALLNLQVDAKRRLATEFRAFGANIVVSPREVSGSNSNTLDYSVRRRVPSDLRGQHIGVLTVLYVVADAFGPGSQTASRLVVAGESGDYLDAEITPHNSGSNGGIFVSSSSGKPGCWVGIRAAEHAHLKTRDLLTLRIEGREEICSVDYIRSVGGPEDDQVTVPLDMAQRLAALPGRISLLQISAPGTTAAINRYIADLTRLIPDADVYALRQFTEAQANIYNRISGLLTATVALVLVLTALCVMAAMTNVAMERKNDVGLMKGIGGATRRVLRLFLAEAALLGLAGGILGATAGLAVSIWLGKAVFGVAARPRLIVYPVAVILTVIVAIVGAYPLRRLASLRPASVFRAEA